uniref:Glycosyltransferase n=1 Tax=Polygala tenuifolia TaxID=355332 RepID=A0A3G3NCZ1_9FABA|nr:UDP-glucosyltransferase UGT86A16 [Polygala tenuifolia]
MANSDRAERGHHSSQKPHAIFIAYPLQGHVIPSVHLAIKLASLGFTITFINTDSIHYQTLKAHGKDATSEDIFTSARNSGLDIRYMTVSDGLPVEFDRSLNHDQFMLSLLHVFSAHVEQVVGKIVKQSNETVTCLIADTFFVWPSKIAKKFGLFHVSFWTEPALIFTLYFHMDLLRKNGHFDCNNVRDDPIDYIPGVHQIHPKDVMSYLQDADTSTVVHQIIFNAFQDVRAADFVLCNTLQDLEPDTIAALRAHLPFYAVGPLFPAGFTKSSVATSLWSESDCTHWLSTKPKSSVLYVSFGSYAHVSKKDLIEIANGLLLSNVNFIWVLRPDIVSSDNVDPLPVGFREAVRECGMIIPWCCQIEVLSDPAVGGFLSHCGWNSILESLWCEVPLLCFPLLTDQFTNRKLVVDDWKVGINLSDHKNITKDDVSRNVNRLMGRKSCLKFVNAIAEVKKLMGGAWTTDGLSQRNMDSFIEGLEHKSRQVKGRITQ